ncbi:MAG: YcxB family protein [Methylobacter sp.]|uniref:YcxB family protein n=1 Tax=Candidatus Methylobacter titanis TaxID=3053457 RepID=A0AA43Q6P0_9GAMM|nr:YcxB family protein [Candidatus Methylobacter titanis]MDI1293935.1 YcxB family protein [Candidatus Methylobacter titanis]
MFEIEYEFREEDLIHFNEIQFLRNEDIQSNIRKNRWIVPGIMGLIGSFYYFYYGDMKSSGYIVVIAILWALLSPKIMMLDLRRQILKNYTAKEKVNMFGTYTLSIDPANANYLLEKSPSGKHKMAWADLVRVEYGKRYVYIYINLSTALVIPVETVKKGNLEQFAEQAEKMIERYA